MKILAVADLRGWIVSRCVDAMMVGIPAEWTKIFWTETPSTRLAELIEEHREGIVYLANWDQGPMFLSVFQAARHPRVVVTVRSWRFSPAAVSFIDRYARMVTCVNAKLAQEFRRRSLHPTVYIPDGVDARMQPSRRPRAGFVGEIGAYKGYGLIERGCAEAGVELVTAARGPDQRSPEAMPAFYESVDCIIVASEAEGFGTVAMEARAMRRPLIITTGEDGAPTGVAAQLLYPGLAVPRTVEGIAAGLFTLFGAPGEQVAYTWSEVNKQFTEVFEEVMSCA